MQLINGPPLNFGRMRNPSIRAVRAATRRRVIASRQMRIVHPVLIPVDLKKKSLPPRIGCFAPPCEASGTSRRPNKSGIQTADSRAGCYQTQRPFRARRD